MHLMKRSKRAPPHHPVKRTKRRTLRRGKPPYVCVPLQEYTQQWGELTRLARDIGEKLATVSLWRAGWRPVPVEKCMKISRATNGYVSVQALRPDIDWST